MAAINGRCTGVLEEGEQITVKIVPLDSLWAIPDGKTIVALALYRKLFAADAKASAAETPAYSPSLCGTNNPECAELGHLCGSN